jgi:hypothetical protein
MNVLLFVHDGTAAAEPCWSNRSTHLSFSEQEESYGVVGLGAGMRILDVRADEPRVTHQLLVCGSGTYLSPYWIDLSDFVLYDALSAVLDASVAAVVTCLNHRLAAVDRNASEWSERLREVLELLEAVNHHLAASGLAAGAVASVQRPAQPRERPPERSPERPESPTAGLSAAVSAATDSSSREPASLALVHVSGGSMSSLPAGSKSSSKSSSMSSSMSSSATRSRLVLLIGSGDPDTWRHPRGVTRLSPRSMVEPEALEALTDFRKVVPHRRALVRAYQRACDVPRRLMFGTSLQPVAWPMVGATALLLLLATELILDFLIVSAFCVLPERVGECVATVAVLPLAGILSPLACTVLVCRALGLLRGVAKGHEPSHAAVAGGAIVRKLRLSALWNLASLPNAVIALGCSVELVVRDHRSLWVGSQLWLLAFALLVTKVLEAQALVILSAAAGFTSRDWRMHFSLRRTRHLSQ